MMNHPRSGRNPFDSLGMDYCLFCKQEVDTNCEAHVEGETYAYKRNCARCGRTINWGVYSVGILETGPTTKTLKAVEWVTTPEQDRS